MSKKLKKLRRQVVDGASQPAQRKKKPDMSKVVSTGSTLLDLAISGGVRKRGGVPGGIVMEIYGPESTGKTAILSEIGGSIQGRGGDIKFLDPEARLDRRYAEIYGVKLSTDKYARPDTVADLFGEIEGWTPNSTNEDSINGILADSLAALTTDLEMSDGGDAYGMRRAKEFSEGLRKTCRMIANNNWLIACSNQEREGPSGTTTPGGKGIPYYASIRIRLARMYQGGIIQKTKKVGKKEIKKTIGIISVATIKKSSIDDPFRTAPIYILFGYGIDDIRANLQWYKDVTGGNKYHCVDANWATMDKAIQYIEDNNLENKLKLQVIKKWHEIENEFKSVITSRKKKRR